ncbi:SIMPL domain-containing protein [Halobacteriovorax sp. GB3]|uniref:SIMPL domain-containing protein n=1 Tax=Halobacteriovorax sp. GB3 TaxID=2719615 RepID=UPI00235F0236|nr:SIMPL domain-containing protein [Halobacteriovorax sp. GB3]MDD0852821.1 SIMPL domain-containing protein [Halobacteriovorax sp. GB3]
MKNLILLFFLSLNTMASSVVVDGISQVFTTSDLASLSFSVETQNKDSLIAQDENSKIMNKALKGLKNKFKIKEIDIKTSRYQLNPYYSYPRGKAPVFEGMKIHNEMTVSIKKIDDISTIINFLTKKGVTKIGAINFSSSKSDLVQVQALEMAFDNAKDKADRLAKRAQLKLGKVLKIEESFERSGMPSPVRYEMKAMSSAPAIEKGSVGVVAKVRVEFEMK